MVKAVKEPKKRRKRRKKVQVEEIEEQVPVVSNEVDTKSGRRPSLTKKRIAGLKLILSMVAGNLPEDKRLDITAKPEYGEAICYIRDLVEYNRYRL